MKNRGSLRAAIRAYVMGHDRVRDRDSKLDTSDLAEDRPIEFGAPIPRARVGVPVPDRLEFHRGPATWRDDLPAPRPPAGEAEASTDD